MMASEIKKEIELEIAHLFIRHRRLLQALVDEQHAC